MLEEDDTFPSPCRSGQQILTFLKLFLNRFSEDRLFMYFFFCLKFPCVFKIILKDQFSFSVFTGVFCCHTMIKYVI